MKDLLAKQRAFFNSGATQSLSFRLKQLKELESMIKRHQADFDAAIYSDFKKSAFENFATETGVVLQEIAHARKHLHHWARRKKVKTNFANFPARSYIIPEPLGVCLIIGAWNYPYLLTLSPIVGAIAAGNTVILKPSELASQTSRVLADAISSYFDAEFITVVEGGIPETTSLLSQKFDKIFFTGSTRVGKIVYKAAAEHLTPVTLELGGKSPAIITKDANLKMTVKRLVWSKFLNAGQTCVAPDYVLIQHSVKDRFLTSLIAELEKVQYAVKNDNYTQIINDNNLERLAGLFATEEVYYGGEVDRKARTISPTILTEVDFSSKVMQDEIFGPILPVISFTDIDEAIEKVRQLPKPLSCYVFTSHRKTKKRVLDRLSFGGGAINEAVMQLANPNLPFGGIGNSGFGAYHGEAGFENFSHQKAIIDKPTWLELPLKYAPYSKFKLKWIKRFLGF